MALYRNIAGFGSGSSVESRPSVGEAGSRSVSRALGLNRSVYLETGLGNEHVGSFFGDVFKGVQHFAAGLGMQIPRAAFLSLVRLNAFHYADKLYAAEQYTDSREKLQDLWWRVGGDEKALRAAIDHGRNTKPAISGFGVGCTTGCTGCTNNGVGCVEAASGTACLIASAAVIVAAIIPVITAMLKTHKDPVVTATPLVEQPTNNNLLLFVKNPVVIAALVALGLYYLTD